uniref:Connexin N-terminal domain-containing protein n=1 Tax=Neogobius melanostomus TaxID=47308 RepID=A0A8C6S8M1_9GOBI
MGEWGFLSGLFDSLQAHSPMLGRFWLLLMLVFRILILGTVASDLFDDEQEEFACNTLQPGCKQVCYDMAFPISQYRFWVFHIVLIATPSLLFLIGCFMVSKLKPNSHAVASRALTQWTASHRAPPRRPSSCASTSSWVWWRRSPAVRNFLRLRKVVLCEPRAQANL